MSLNLLGQYSSESESDADTPTTTNDTPIANAPPSCVTSETVTYCEDSPEKGKSYFDECSSDNSSTGSSRDEEEEEGGGGESSDDSAVPKSKNVKEDSIPLPLPDLERIHSGRAEATPGSVFSNPYKEEEDAKLAVLKKHVILAPTEEPMKEEKKRFNRRRKSGRGGRRGGEDNELFDSQDSSIKRKNFKRIKSGLPNNLIPSNKYMKFHEKQQAEERPWTLDGKHH